MIDYMYVKWEDHCTRYGWVRSDDIDSTPIIVESIGVLVEETDKTIVLSTSSYPSVESSYNFHADPLVILKATVLKKKKMRYS